MQTDEPVNWKKGYGEKDINGNSKDNFDECNVLEELAWKDQSGKIKFMKLTHHS